jgi:hypothetical protein
VTAENQATVFCTGNGVTISPDMRRRSLVAELHLEVERAEDRKFKRTIELPTLMELRPKLLSALWSLVKYWNMQGRPEPSRTHSAFPSWAEIIGGIVEAAGFPCPFETGKIAATADPDSEDMHSLVHAMAEATRINYSFGELIALGHENGLFEHVIGSTDDDLARREKSMFSKLLGRYDHRLVAKYRFIVEGKGKTRRYRIEDGNGGHGQNGVSVETSQL